MPKVEHNSITGIPTKVYGTLNKKISAYKANNTFLKVGITGRKPQIRFNEHLQDFAWKRMVVIYKTKSSDYANTLEEWLVEKHWNDLTNERKGGNSELAEKGYNYVYLLLA